MKYRKYLFIFFVFLLSMLTFNVNAKNEKYNIVSGDFETVGSEICFGNECFYVVSSSENAVSLFAKYNLYVGNSIDESYNYTELEPTYLQDSRAIGYNWNNKEVYPFVGVVPFSNVSNKYDGSVVEEYVNKYVEKLTQSGLKVSSSRLINKDELENLGCDSTTYLCDKAPKWVYSSSYWVGVPSDIARYAWYVDNYSYFVYTNYYSDFSFGVRPVIEVPLGYFYESTTQNVFAAGVDLGEFSEGVISNTSGEVDLVFNDLGQSAKYEAVIYNDSDNVMRLDQFSVDGISEDFVDIKLDEKAKNMVINPRSSAKVGFTIKTLMQENAGYDFEDDFMINFRLTSEVANPNTGSNILEIFALITIFGVTIYFVKKINNKKVELLVLVGVIGFVGTLYVNAKDYINIEFTGKIKYVSQNVIMTTGVFLDGGEAIRSNANELWTYYNDIDTIEIKNMIVEPEEYYKKIDISENGSEKVLAYLVEQEDSSFYKLIIMANGKIKANKDSSFLLSFIYLEKLEGLSNIDFSETESMRGMFYDDYYLEELDITSLDMTNVKDTSYMFFDCYELDLNQNDFNLENVENTNNMFGRRPV